jgi:hypothetical protein
MHSTLLGILRVGDRMQATGVRIIIYAQKPAAFSKQF